MKASLPLVFVIFMAGGLDEKDKLSPPPTPHNTPEKPEPEGLKRVSSGEITITTEQEGEGKSPKQFLAKNGQVVSPAKVRRTKSCLSGLTNQEKK